MKAYQPPCKLAVRDSLDDEFSDDVEDDVFIRDGKSSKVSTQIFFNTMEIFHQQEIIIQF